MEGEEAEEPTALMDGAEVFEPDWRDIDANLSGHVDARQAATGG
jgi:2-aminoethylphosphonate transport system substrate-binding protein